MVCTSVMLDILRQNTENEAQHSLLFYMSYAVSLLMSDTFGTVA